MSDTVKDQKNQIVDRSLVQPILKQHLWRPIGERLPDCMSPNTISMFGLVSMFTSCLFTWLAVRGSQWWFLATVCCIGIYLTCDNVDGVFARRTDQTSQLGEFFDHWFDTFASGVLTIGVGISLGLHGWLFLGYVMLVAWLQFATFWQQLHTGKMMFDRLGSNESVIMVMGVFLLLAFFKGQPWLMHEEWRTSLALGLALLTAGASGFSLAGILLRNRGERVLDMLSLLLAMGGFLAAYGLGLLNSYLAGIGIAVANTLGCSGMLLERIWGCHFIMRALRLLGLLVLLMIYLLLAHYQGTDSTAAKAVLLTITGLAAVGIVWDFVRAWTLMDRPKKAR